MIARAPIRTPPQFLGTPALRFHHVCLLLASALPVPIRLLPCPLAPLLFTCVRVPRHVVQLCIFICVHVPLHAAHCSPFLYMLGLPCALPLSTHGSPCSDANVRQPTAPPLLLVFHQAVFSPPLTSLYPVSVLAPLLPLVHNSIPSACTCVPPSSHFHVPVPSDGQCCTPASLLAFVHVFIAQCSIPTALVASPAANTRPSL